MSFVLSDTASAFPAYFSLNVIDNVPSGQNGHWQPDTDTCLQFARKEDAENFARFYLRHDLNIIVKEI